jgi:glycosyltransferase involved in cell wall biosynthesis
MTKVQDFFSPTTTAVPRTFVPQFSKERGNSMLGIVIPAHNEEACIGAAVRAATTAAAHPGLLGEEVRVLVVLDDCSDKTAQVARSAGAETLEAQTRNVGAARAAGAEALLKAGARWLAFTDADSIVCPNWLVDQLSLDADAVCGTVAVDDWSPHGIHAPLIRSHFLETYFDRDDHPHIHGANLGVSAAAYRLAGGFLPLRCDEDVQFVDALHKSGARIARSAKPRVVTSARRNARAAGGFADALLHAIATRLATASNQAADASHFATSLSLTALPTPEAPAI